jgi:hypothetical protein
MKATLHLMQQVQNKERKRKATASNPNPAQPSQILGTNETPTCFPHIKKATVTCLSTAIRNKSRNKSLENTSPTKNHAKIKSAFNVQHHTL